jgi:hypothetical protein
MPAPEKSTDRLTHLESRLTALEADVCAALRQLRSAIHEASAWREGNPAGIEPFNMHVVGFQDGSLMMLRPPHPGETLSHDRAMLLAAWLVALSRGDRPFADYLAAVEAT